MIPQKQLSQWRTAIGLLALGVFMLIALALTRDVPNGPALFSSAVTGLGGLGLWLAGKSGVEHVANAAAAGKAKEPAASILAEAAAKT